MNVANFQLVVVLIGLVATESTFSNPDERLRYAHGGCMSVWTILTLGGMFASRMMKHKGPIWIRIHAVAMVTASVAGIGGILLGIMNGAHERSQYFKKNHFLIEYVHILVNLHLYFLFKCPADYLLLNMFILLLSS